MFRTLPVTAALACTLSMAALPALTTLASAQEPPSAPTPSEAGVTPSGGGSMSKESPKMSKGSMKKKHTAKKHKAM